MTDEELMALAIVEAKSSLEHQDVPVGAIVVAPDGKVIASRHNERELTSDPTAHAEVLAIRDAATALGSWRLTDCTLVATLEPCPMCAGSLVNSRVSRVVFGAHDMTGGAVGSLYNLCSDPRLNHEVEITSGILAPECAELLTDFFATKRA